MRAIRLFPAVQSNPRIISVNGPFTFLSNLAPMTGEVLSPTQSLQQFAVDAPEAAVAENANHIARRAEGAR